MKKVMSVILICLILIACQTKKDVLNLDVDHIYFITGVNTYEVKEEKYQEVLTYLDNIESFESKNASEIAEFWSIQIDEEKLYLNEDGTFVYQNKLYIPDDETLAIMYKNALGGDIFKGSIFLNEEWIKDANTNQQIFSISINKVNQVTFEPSPGIKYRLREEKLETFIQAINNTKTYPYIEYTSESLFGYGIHHIYVEQDEQKLHFELIDDGKVAYILMYVEHLNLYDNAEWVYIYLSDPEISKIYMDMFGEKNAYIAMDENVKLEINDEWLEDVE